MNYPRLALRSATVAIFLFLGAGCQSTPKTSPGPDGTDYTRTVHDLKVWKSPIFDLRTLKSAMIEVDETVSEVPAQTKANEASQFDRLRRSVGDQIRYALHDKDFNPARPGETKAPYRLQTAITEYYPGNPALRFTVGFGAGYPSITVRGTLIDTAANEPVFRFETQREFEPRLFEYGDEQILDNNIRDLAMDFTDYLDRSAAGLPLKD